MASEFDTTILQEGCNKAVESILPGPEMHSAATAYVRAGVGNASNVVAA